jgi:ketosteroid isomerase-like protein
MSEKNVEIAESVIEAYNRRDVDAVVELGTPDFEWLPATARIVEDRGYKGRAGFESYLVEIGSTWEELRATAEEFRDLGDSVLVLGRMEGRGTSSRVPVGAPLGMVFEFRDGKVSRVQTYLDHGEALRAAGLAE